jgi:hypothetical protein
LETISITVNDFRLNFDYARRISWAVAKSYNPHTSLKAWFDREQGCYSPARTESGTDGLPDWEEYGLNQGGRKKVVVGDGEYIFIYT